MNSSCGQVNTDYSFEIIKMHMWSISMDGGQSKSQWQQHVLNEVLEKNYDGPIEPHNQESHADGTSWRARYCQGPGRGSFSQNKEISKNCPVTKIFKSKSLISADLAFSEQNAETILISCSKWWNNDGSGLEKFKNAREHSTKAVSYIPLKEPQQFRWSSLKILH